MCAQARFGIGDGRRGRQVLGCVCSGMLQLRNRKQWHSWPGAIPTTGKYTIRLCENRKYARIQESWLFNFRLAESVVIRSQAFLVASV